MKKISFILILVTIIIIDKTAFTQDVQFSQFYATPLYLSPSFAGSANGSRLTMNYRNQWPQLGTLITSSFSFDHNFKDWNTGLGILVVADQAGDGKIGTINTGIIYSYDIKINPKMHMRPGINFQFAQAGVDFSELYDVTNINSSGSITGFSSYETMGKSNYFDLSFSTIIYTKDYWGGLTIDHLFRPAPSLLKVDQADTRIPLRFSLYGGTKYIIKKSKKKGTEESISGVLLFTKQSTSNQFNIGVYWNYTPVVIGAFYRGIPVLKNNLGGHDALIILAGWKIENIKISYSYDYTVSDLAGISGGAHEVSIIYLFNSIRVQKKKRWKAVPCPDYIN